MAVAIAAALYPEVRDVIARGIARQAALMLEQQDEALVQQWQMLRELAA